MWELNRHGLLAFGVLLVDQAFDLLVEVVMPLGASWMLASSWLGVTHFPGPSGGALDTNGFFLIVGIVLIPFYWQFKLRPHPDPLYAVGLGLILGGVLGNLADGLRVGYPVDYLIIGRPINPADVALLLGVSVLLYRMRTIQHTQATFRKNNKSK